MAVWVNPVSLELVNARSKDNAIEHLDIRFIEVGDDYLKATMPVDHRTKQPNGLMHGGATCLLAETVANTAANFCVKQPEFYCVGVEINANHLRPVKEGLVTAVAKPIHLGRKIQVWHIDVFNDELKQVSVSRLTMAVLQKK